MTVFGYMRVSTTRQAEEELSIEVQRQQIEAYAKLNTLTVHTGLSDLGISGSVELSQREGGARILNEATSGDVVIFSKLDRMFRSASNALNVLEELKKRGISLILVAQYQMASVNLYSRFYQQLRNRNGLVFENASQRRKLVCSKMESITAAELRLAIGWMAISS